jgi:translation initiation factor 2B subunit (eIF-2B alpha/beta/delta family)
MKKRDALSKTIKDIKDVKIQGATDIAKEGIKAYMSNPSEESLNRIIEARPTEPLLRNLLKNLHKSKNKKKDAKKLSRYIENSHKKIAIAGSKLIKSNMNVFVHCHSTTVIEILKKAKKQKKNFVVYVPEVEPLLQGRKTAKDLAKAKIKTIVFPDFAAEQFLKKCDIFLFGADAYTPRKIVNKIGTSALCRIAKYYKIPRMKFTKKVKMEKRIGREVWDARNKLIVVKNPAFDIMSSKLLTGIISEFGVTSYKTFLKKIKSKN